MAHSGKRFKTENWSRQAKDVATGQVLFRRLSANFALALPFKDSQGGTWTLELSGLSKDTALRSNVASSKFHFGEAS